MFPNVRLMIAAMVASVVALSCGFGRVRRFPRQPRAIEPARDRRRAAATRGRQSDAVAPQCSRPRESFGGRFPLNQAAIAGAAAVQHRRRSADQRSANVAPPTAPSPNTAPARNAETGAAEPDARRATPRRSRKRRRAKPWRQQNEAAPSEAPAATSDTAAIEPPAEQASGRRASRAHGTSRRQETKPDIAKTTAAEPSPAQHPSVSLSTGAAWPPSRHAPAKPARFNPAVSPPVSAVPSSRRRTAAAPAEFRRKLDGSRRRDHIESARPA